MTLNAAPGPRRVLRSHLVAVAHQGPAAIPGAQETVDQHGPAQREVEAHVLLEVAAQPVTGQVVAQAEDLARDQLGHLLPDQLGQQRLQTL